MRENHLLEYKLILADDLEKEAVAFPTFDLKPKKWNILTSRIAQFDKW